MFVLYFSSELPRVQLLHDTCMNLLFRLIKEALSKTFLICEMKNPLPIPQIENNNQYPVLIDCMINYPYNTIISITL